MVADYDGLDLEKISGDAQAESVRFHAFECLGVLLFTLRTSRDCGSTEGYTNELRRNAI